MTSVTIAQIHWRPYRLPLRQDFTTSSGTLLHRYGAMIELRLNNGLVGYGEIAPLPYYQDATLANVLAHGFELAAELEGRTLDDGLARVVEYARAATFPAALLCGTEMALYDALAKQEQRSLAVLLASEQAVIRSAVSVNVVIGSGDLDASLQAAQAAVAAGYRCVKLKVGMLGSKEQEVRQVAAVRAAIGPEVALRLDANAAWTLDEATELLAACAPYNIQYVEQPLPAANLDEMRQLRQRVAVPIAADEALTSLDSARRILQGEAADVLVIKPQTVGGLAVSREIVHMATERGIECVLTSAIESGIGIAATLQLASSLPEVTLACGLATLPLLTDDLILEELTVRNGELAVPQGTGLGVTLDEAALNRYAV